jgi:hypothetical protein
MRITLNLAIAPSARERYALYWAFPATLVGLVALVFLLLSTLHSFHEYKRVEKSVVECQSHVNALAAQEAALRRRLGDPKARQLLSNAQFINALIDDKRFSLTDLAVDITRLMPADVCLTGLASAPEGEELAVRFVITGKNEEALELFLSNLEDSPRFRDVAIINQGFEQQGATSELENIACTAHYLVGDRGSSEE